MLAFFEFDIFERIKKALDQTTLLAGTLLDPKSSQWQTWLPTLLVFAGMIALLIMAGIGAIFKQPNTPPASGEENPEAGAMQR